VVLFDLQNLLNQYKAGEKMNFVLCSDFDNADEILQYAMQYFEKCHYYPKIKVAA
jgi:hypothetical protein